MTDANRRRTGRPPLTDRATLLAAARRIGFVDLTVGTVTADVGVKYSTFYRHFTSFEALLCALVDQVLDETAFPEPGPDWREHLTRTSATMFDVLRRHPGLGQVLVRLPQRPDRLVRIWAGTTDVLLAAGFSAKDTVLGTTGAFELAIHPWIDSPGTGAGAPIRRDQAQDPRHPIDDRVRRAMADAVDDPPTGWIGDKIDLLVEGLAARLPATG